MIQFFKELYLTGFTLGFRFASDRWSYPSNLGKGIGFVTLLEGLILTGIAGWIEMYLGTRFLLNAGKVTIWIVYVALGFANYYILIIRGHGTKFEREFSNLPKAQKNFLLASCAVILLVTMVFMIYSVSAYQHFFHIIPKSGW